MIVAHWAVIRPKTLEGLFRLSLKPLDPFMTHVSSRVDSLVFRLRFYAQSDVLLQLSASCCLVREAVFKREFAHQCFPARNCRIVIHPLKLGEHRLPQRQSSLTDHRHDGRALAPFTELIRCWAPLPIIRSASDYFPQLLCLPSLEFVLLLLREQ